jgi:hypothetical protein
MDADPDPAIFVSDLQDVNIKVFSLLLFLDTFLTFFKDKVTKKPLYAAAVHFFLADDDLQQRE